MWTTKDITDQKGRSIIITGSNTGIGYETALALYQAGAHIIVACRDKHKAEKAIAEIKSKTANGTLTPATLDLASLSSVKEFADWFTAHHHKLDLLINNAGVATPPASKNSEGYELQFGVNFLGHFALTGLLYPLLLATEGSRIITVSSNGYQNAVIDFDNLRSEKNYESLREYRQSKLANLMFSIELNRRIKAKGEHVVSVAAQPGANRTELTRHLSAEEIEAGIKRLGAFMEPWQGALSVLFAATSNTIVGGHMYEPEEGGLRGYPVQASIQENAMNTDTAKQLWDVAEQATQIFYP